MDSKKYIKYKKDLDKCGIKTSKLYFYTTFPKTILVEQNIKGYNLQDIMNDTNNKPKDKLIKKSHEENCSLHHELYKQCILVDKTEKQIKCEQELEYNALE